MTDKDLSAIQLIDARVLQLLQQQQLKRKSRSSRFPIDNLGILRNRNATSASLAKLRLGKDAGLGQLAIQTQSGLRLGK